MAKHETRSKRTQRKSPAKNPADPSWLERFKAEVQGHVLRGDYEGGLRVARDALKLYPNDITCQYQYAKLLGDWADELPLKRKSRYKREAIAILRPLTRRLSGRDADERFGLCLNFYYQSEAFSQMARFGLRQARRGVRKGHYAHALGTCLEAQRLARQGKASRSRAWAARSIESWKRYGLGREKYYFAHYSFALALALAGRSSEARARIEVAAKLSGRTVDDWEFADVMRLVRAGSSG